MGGKKEKESQRTKGNTRPSSSARSAALLGSASASTAASGFIGFGGSTSASSSSISAGGGGANAPAFVPLAGLEEADAGAANLPGEFRVILRKMGKKDVVTRLKAVQEFQELCNSSSGEICVNVLKFWPRIFSKISFDHDRRVREGAQKILLILIEKVGRNLAPQLKALMPFWYISQFDPHVPAAYTAKASFKAAFSGKEEKMREAILFCRNEIQAAIEDYILNQTPETLSDPRSSSPEDIESKYQRVISSSLSAYASLIAQTSREDFHKCEDFHKKMLSDQKFWKLATHKAATVRCSWFQVAAAICDFFPSSFFVEIENLGNGGGRTETNLNLYKKLSSAIFSNLDAKEIPVLESSWDSALSFTSKTQKWHTLVKLEKFVIPKIINLLRSGQALVVYSKLLPLLAQFPRDNPSIKVEPILRALTVGLDGEEKEVKEQQEEEDKESLDFITKRRKTYLSLPEKRRGLEAFFECAIFALENFIREKEAIMNLVFQRVENCLALATVESSADSKIVFNNFGKFLRNSYFVKKEADFLEFWNKFSLKLKDLFVTASNANDEMGLDRISTLLVTLLICEKKYQGKVKIEDQRRKLRFAEETGGEGDKVTTKPGLSEKEQSIDIPPRDFPLFETKLEALTGDLFCMAFQNFEEVRSPQQIGFISHVLNSGDKSLRFDSIFGQMARHFGTTAKENDDDDSSYNKSAISFARNEIVQKIIDDDKSAFAVYYEDSAKLAADIVLTSRLDKTDEKVVFYSYVMAEVRNQEWLFVFVQRLCQRKETEPSVKVWLSNQEFGCKMAEMAENVAETLNHGNTTFEGGSWRILKIAFEHGDFIPEDHLKSILVSFTQSIKSISKPVQPGAGPGQNINKNLDGILSFLCQLLLSLQNCNRLCWQVGEAKEIIFALFKLQCFADKDVFSNETLTSLKSVWIPGLSFLSYEQEVDDDDSDFFGQLLNEMSDVVKCRVFDSGNLNFGNLDFVLDNVGSMIRSVLELISTETSSEPQPQKQLKQQRKQEFIAKLMPPGAELEKFLSVYSAQENLNLVLSGGKRRHLRIEFFAAFPPGEADDCNKKVSSHFPTTKTTNDLESSKALVFAQFFGQLIRDLFYDQEVDFYDNNQEEQCENEDRYRIGEGENDNYFLAFEKPVKSEEKKEKEGEEKFEKKIVPFCPPLLDLLVEFYRTVSFVRNFPEENPEKNLRNKILQEKCEHLAREIFRTILSFETRKKVLSKILEKSLDFGFGWTETLDFFIELVKDDQEELNIDKVYEMLDQNSERDGIIQTKQVLISRSTTEKIVSVLATEVAKLMSLTVEEDENLSLSHFLPGLIIVKSCLVQLNGHNDDIKDEEEFNIRPILQIMNDLRTKFEEQLLFDCSLDCKDWAQVSLVQNYCQIWKEILRRFSSLNEVSGPHWDVILCSVSSWIQTFEESKEMLTSLHTDSKGFQSNIKLVFFSEPVFELVAALGKVMSTNSLIDKIPQNTREEWNEFFLEGIFSNLLPSFVYVANSTEILGSDNVSRSLGSALKYIPNDQLFKHNLEPKFQVEDLDCSANYPDNLTFLMNHLAPLITMERCAVQLSSFQILNRVMEQLINEEESQNVKSDFSPQEGEQEDHRELPRRLCELLKKTQPVLEKLFLGSDFEFGEEIPVPENTWAYNYTRAYLLTWKLILKFVSGAQSQLRPKFSEYMRKEGLLDLLVPVLFHLVTSKNGVHFQASGDADPEADDVGAGPDEIRIHACQVFVRLLKHLPAMFRNWFHGQEKKIADLVEKVTMNHVTPILWQDEITAINSSKVTFDNMTIRVRASVREVLAVYTVDESSMELVIQLPSNFPLGAVKVESGKRVGVGISQWRNWMLQLTTFLQHQNGSILDGLTVWKQNVDKRFEGVEECYICFYILHGANHQLPKLACRTCKKKFHSACLYKWFSTSNNSTCPLCRNLF